MAVINPLKIKIINYNKQEGENINFEINPQNEKAGKREIAFTNEMFIEKEDFQENPEEGFFRLSPGEEVRLKNAYIIKAVDICLLYTSPSPRDATLSRMPSSA